MTQAKAVITLVLVGLVTIFVIQNARAVEINFLFWSVSVPRALLVVILVAVGFVLGITASSFSRLKGK